MWGQESTVDGVRHPSKDVPIFTGLQWDVRPGILHTSDWSIPDAVHWLLHLIDPTRNNTCLNSFGFMEGACKIQCTSNSIMHSIILFGCRLGFWSCEGCELILFLPKTFSLYIVINNSFLIACVCSLQKLDIFWCIWAENHGWKCGP